MFHALDNNPWTFFKGLANHTTFALDRKYQPIFEEHKKGANDSTSTEQVQKEKGHMKSEVL